MARARDLTVRILEQRELKRLGMGGILGVGQGSDRPPRLIVVRYRPRRRPRKIVVLVGKSITFDSGGLSIKPAKGMEEMKYDMSGGAAVLGALQAFSRLKPPVEVIGILPASENVIGGSALRPGDILRSASGKTIEIINTDAEGRLVLADALHYAQRFKPDFLIDLATLTGACLVALGTQVSGMVTNDKELSRKVFEAGERAGERVWELPLYDEFIEATKSQIADLKNSAGRNAGAITAAAFLSHFVGKTKWCHLDIAGTAWSDRESGHLAPGATGMGVRLMVEFVTALG
jgi:leucyl aminopeptidase